MIGKSIVRFSGTSRINEAELYKKESFSYITLLFNHSSHFINILFPHFTFSPLVISCIPFGVFLPIQYLKYEKKHLAIHFTLVNLLDFFFKLLTGFKRKNVQPQPPEPLVSSHICILVAVSRFVQSILQCRELFFA